MNGPFVEILEGLPKLDETEGIDIILKHNNNPEARVRILTKEGWAYQHYTHRRGRWRLQHEDGSIETT